MLNGGGSRDYHLQHLEAKYAKFAYSAHFGFGVGTDSCCAARRGPDSTLLLSDDDVDNDALAGEKENRYYKERGFTSGHAVGEAHLYSRWQPWKDVLVETWLCVPRLPWHLRLHHVTTGRDLYAVEGGFALPRSDAFYEDLPRLVTETAGKAMVHGETGLSGLFDPRDRRTGEVLLNTPNSNLLHRRTLTPVLRGKLPRGEMWLMTLVAAHPNVKTGDRLWNRLPTLGEIRVLLPADVKPAFEQAAV
jgi:hypothetical protein